MERHLQRKKAVARTLRDILVHKKTIVSEQDKNTFFYICEHVLRLSHSDIEDALTNMNNGLVNITLIGELDKTHQIAFRNLTYQLISRNRPTSELEKNDFNAFLEVIPNPYNLPNTYDEFINSHYKNDGSFLGNEIDCEIRPWNFPWQ